MYFKLLYYRYTCHNTTLKASFFFGISVSLLILFISPFMSRNMSKNEEEHSFVADENNWRQVVATERGAVHNWYSNWGEFYQAPTAEQKIKELEEKVAQMKESSSFTEKTSQVSSFFLCIKKMKYKASDCFFYCIIHYYLYVGLWKRKPNPRSESHKNTNLAS